MKKTVYALLFIAMLFTGCSANQSNHPKETITLNIWHYYNGAQREAFNHLVDEFNETVGKEKGIVVDAYNQGGVNELAEKVVSSAKKEVGSQEMPDIFSSYSDTALIIDNMGLVANLDGYFTPAELDTYVDTFIEEGRWGSDNSLKLVPIAKTSEMVMVNKTDWDKFAAGIKESRGITLDIYNAFQYWENIDETAKLYYEWTDAQTPDTPNDGKAMFGLDVLANYMLVGSAQLGAPLIHVSDNKGNLQLDRNMLKKLWDNYYIPYLYGYYANFGRFRSDDAKTGDIIALLGSTTGCIYFPNEVTLSDGSSYSIEVVSLPTPAFKGGKPVTVQQGASMVVTKSTPEKETAAVEFLKWFTEPERNMSFLLETGYMPVKKLAYEKEFINAQIEGYTEGELTDVIKDSIQVAYSQMESHDYYISKPYYGGVEVRKVLENSMSAQVMLDLELLNNAGENREAKLTELLSDQHFDDWSAQFTKDLEQAIQ